MRTINLKGQSLEMYDSIEEMPITIFQKYNKNVLIDSGIGSDIQSIDGHISTIRRYIAIEDKKKADQVLLNMRQGMAFVVSETSPKMNAFVCLIKGADLTDEGISKRIKELGEDGLTYGILTKFLESVKKK